MHGMRLITRAVKLYFLAHLGQPEADELQHGHLGSGVLHGHPVRPQPQVAGASLNVLTRGVIQMGVEDLFSLVNGSIQPRLDHLEVLDELLLGHEGLLVELGHG